MPPIRSIQYVNTTKHKKDHGHDDNDSAAREPVNGWEYKSTSEDESVLTPPSILGQTHHNGRKKKSQKPQTRKGKEEGLLLSPTTRRLAKAKANSASNESNQECIFLPGGSPKGPSTRARSRSLQSQPKPAPSPSKTLPALPDVDSKQGKRTLLGHCDSLVQHPEQDRRDFSNTNKNHNSHHDERLAHGPTSHATRTPSNTHVASPQCGKRKQSLTSLSDSAKTSPSPSKYRKTQGDKRAAITPSISTFDSCLIPKSHQSKSSSLDQIIGRIIYLARGNLWSKDQTVMLQAMEELVGFCMTHSEEDNACRQAMLHAGVHTVTIRALEIYSESLHIQVQGLELLFRMSISPADVLPSALITMGAPEVAITAMLQFSNETEIATVALVLLGNLLRTLEQWRLFCELAERLFLEIKTIPPAKPKSPRNRQTKLARGDAQLTGDTSYKRTKVAKGNGKVAALKVGDSNADTQALYQNPSIPRDCVLLQLVFQALEAHPNAEEIQEAGAYFLDCALQVAGPQLTDMLIEHCHGHIGALLLASNNFGWNKHLCKRVQSIFRVLLTSKSTRVA